MRALRDFLLAPPDGGRPRAIEDFEAAARPAAAGAGPGVADGGTARTGCSPARVATSRATSVRVPAGSRAGWAGALRPIARLLLDLPQGDDAPPRATRRHEPSPPGRAIASAGAPRAVAILCAAEDARALGVAAAGLLARRARVSCALVCLWTPFEARPRSDARPPASRAARRLAVMLASRGHDVVACGRAAVVVLPADPAEAVTAAARAGAAAGATPAVLVLGGPRAAAFDDLLAEQDRLLVVSRPAADPAIGALALFGLPPGGSLHHACTVGLGALGRAATAAGLATPSALRDALNALDGDGA